MRKFQAQLGFIVAAAILALPSAALAQRVVPPGNSAANQYTETFPTAKGPAATRKRGKQRHRSPAEALGPRKARRLASEGPQGRELAAVVAATAPSAAQPGGARGAGSEPGSHSGSDPRSGSVSRGDAVDDSSGLGEVVSQATGSSDTGGMGIALPLLILAAFVASAVYLWRRRRLAA
jgi:cobalamin biosynthesis Mg chelatase CobN